MKLKLQKFSPIDREYSIIEIIDEGNDVLLDVSRNDDGLLEVCFHPSVSNRVLPYDELMASIEQARVRALADD